MQKKTTNVKLPRATVQFFHVLSQDKREVTPTLVPLTTHLTVAALIPTTLVSTPCELPANTSSCADQSPPPNAQGTHL